MIVSLTQVAFTLDLPFPFSILRIQIWRAMLHHHCDVNTARA